MLKININITDLFCVACVVKVSSPLRKDPRGSYMKPEMDFYFDKSVGEILPPTGNLLHAINTPPARKKQHAGSENYRS